VQTPPANIVDLIDQKPTGFEESQVKKENIFELAATNTNDTDSKI
jgi:hypothetical protein